MKRKIIYLLITAIAVIFVFVSCGQKSDFTYEQVEGGIVITGYTGENMNVVIPEQIGGENVVAIGEGAFDAMLIESIELPKSVTEIGKYAFRRCGNLTTVNILGNLKTIPAGAFNFCSSLTEIDFPDTVEIIGENAFGKSSLTKVILPDSVKTINDYAFYHCASLKTFIGGNGLEKIGNNVFGGCTSLNDITLKEGIKTIGEYAFSACNTLTNIDIPTSLEKLSVGIFSSTAITEIFVPSGIKTIESYAFAGCKYLKNVYIPETVEKMEIDIFNECKDFVICGIRDSEAEIFADTYGFKFQVHKFD